MWDRPETEDYVCTYPSSFIHSWFLGCTITWIAAIRDIPRTISLCEYYLNLVEAGSWTFTRTYGYISVSYTSKCFILPRRHGN